jgi:hypothetical protein
MPGITNFIELCLLLGAGGRSAGQEFQLFYEILIFFTVFTGSSQWNLL